MSDDRPDFETADLEPIDLETIDPLTGDPTTGHPELANLEPASLEPGSSSPWPPGWYADPWSAGQYRRWNGQAWTGETHRTGPVTTLLHAPPTAASDPPVTPGSPTTTGWPTPGSPTTPGPPLYPPARVPARGRRGAWVAALIVVALLAGAVGYAIEASTEPDDTAGGALQVPGTTAPGPTTPAPTGADRIALGSLVVRQSDVVSPRVVVLIPNGNRTSEPTLDLCNGTFPSEKQRAARLQVAEIVPTGDAVLSTEAVTYKRVANGAQAFAELRKVRANCPHRPVTSPVGGGTAETAFKAAPDGTWAHTKSVERLAYSFTTTSAGTTSPSIAVYLRRGRVLMGVYFPQPNGAQPAVDGKTSIQNIVKVFEERIARLPAKVVGD